MYGDLWKLGRKLGHSKKDILGKKPLEIFGEPLLRNLHIENNHKCINELSKQVFEWSFFENNQHTYYQNHLLPYYDGNGKFVGIINITRDISHFRKIEENLKGFIP